MKRVLVFVVLVLGILVLGSPASAHPLGKFSVNQAVALTFAPRSVVASVAVDFAELPTLAARSTVDTSGGAVCRDFLASFSVGELRFALAASSFSYQPGSAGLSTSRVTCTLTAPATLSIGSSLPIANGYMADRVGWREMTASGSGLSLSTTLPSVSPSSFLTVYPSDLLSSPVDVRTGTVRITSSPSSVSSPSSSASSSSPGGWTAAFEDRLDTLVGTRNLTPIAGLLAVLLSLILGAAHAALPGHGKTVMAAYMAGRDGRPRDALAVGATVTLTHTGGVLLLGLALTGFASLAGDRVLGGLGVASGVLVAAVGVALLVRALRGAAPHAHGPHTHSHGGHSHGPHTHSHDGFAQTLGGPVWSGPTAQHSHFDEGGAGTAPRRRDRLGMIGLGVAGGLVPSPTALLVLLGAIGFGRTAFGVGLVLAYGLGMAATLTAAGLLLVKVRHSLVDRPLFARVRAALPLTTSGLILVVGLGMAVRAAAAFA